MRPVLFCSSILPLVFSTAVFASAGATSSGVTTSVGNSNDPSPEVQAQSSGFVQQNQQLQNAQAPNGTAAASNPGIAAVPNAANGTNNAGAAGNAAQHADSAPAAAAATPPPPPPPPPVYESTIRKLDRSSVSANVPPPVVPQKPEQDPAPGKPEPKPVAAPPPAPVVAKAPPKPAAPDTSVGHPNVPATEAPAERSTAPPQITGGRGEAPDGFTFYSGSAIASMLLAFAFATYLKTGRIESAK